MSKKMFFFLSKIVPFIR